MADSVGGTHPPGVCPVTHAGPDPQRMSNATKMAIYLAGSGVPAPPASLFSNAWWLVAHYTGDGGQLVRYTVAECLARCNTCVSHTWAPSTGEYRTIPESRLIRIVGFIRKEVRFEELHESVVANDSTRAIGLSPPPKVDPPPDAYNAYTHEKLISRNKSFSAFATVACIHFTVPACALLANTPIWRICDGGRVAS